MEILSPSPRRLFAISVHINGGLIWICQTYCLCLTYVNSIPMQTPKIVEIWADASFSPKYRVMSWAFCIVNGDSNEEMSCHCRRMRISEYKKRIVHRVELQAILAALRKVQNRPPSRKIVVHSDHKNNVRLLNGFKPKRLGGNEPLFEDIRKIKTQLEKKGVDVEFVWVNRKSMKPFHLTAHRAALRSVRRFRRFYKRQDKANEERKGVMPNRS